MSERKKKFWDPKDVFERFYTRLYIYMAKEVKETFGKEGEEAIKRALINFGHERGEELRKKHEELGIPITVKSLFENYDLPLDDEKFERNTIKLTENVRYSRTYNCPWQETWRKIAPDSPELWSLYCDTVHQAVFEAYIDDIICELPLILTKGDQYCQFEVYRKGHKDEIPRDE